MIVATGHLSLLIAGLLSLLLMIASWLYRDQEPLMIRKLLSLVFAMMAVSFLSLMVSFIRSDFSLMSVVLHCAVKTPLIYKISAVWSHHEGSMLLWLLIITLYNLIVSKQKLPWVQKRLIIMIQSLVTTLFVVFTAVVSNPFRRLDPVALDGRDLNPLLQDYSVIFHPPILYAGLQALSVVFSCCLAIILTRHDMPNQVLNMMRKWTLAGMALLTVGIALGSFWAYYELGWGGWWFWDPVENISLLPWLIAIALLHSLNAHMGHNSLKRWTLFLALMGYVCVLVGLLLVRSGLLVSVHGFAQDNERALALMVLVSCICIPALALFAVSFKDLETGRLLGGINKLWLLVSQSVIFFLAATVLLLGVTYPIVAGLFMEQGATLGGEFYQATVLPILLLGVFLVGMVPFVGKDGPSGDLIKRYAFPSIVCVGASLLLYVWTQGAPFYRVVAFLSVMIGAWVMVMTAVRLIQLRGQKKLSSLGMWIAHFGVAALLVCIGLEKGWNQEEVFALKPGQSLHVHNAKITFKNISRMAQDNYVSEKAQLEIRQSSRCHMLSPEKRTYIPAHMMTSESAMCPYTWGVYYVTMGDSYDDGAVSFRFSSHPMVWGIWLSALIMAVGLVLSWAQKKRLAKTLSKR
jgi:cytochrome c-type biogenesis protein CcmF